MNPTPPPRQLGKYEIIAEMTRDSIGVTYRGRDPVLDAPVALRVLAPYLAQDTAFMAQFRQEMRGARGLKHPHILAIYDFGTDRDTVFMVTELVEDQSLAELLAGGQQMDIDRVVAMAEQIADALDYAHSQGVIHQDLKPVNILIGPNDQVTVTGFGLARAMQGTPMAASQAYSTVAYWSPEQAEGQPATAASDRYALAAFVYEMLTGRPPFVGETSLAVLRQIADKTAPAPSQLRAGLPPGVDSALSRALAKKAEERYPNARDLVKGLSQAPEPKLPTTPPERDEKELSIAEAGEHTLPQVEREVVPDPPTLPAPPVVPAIPSLQLLMEFQSESRSITTMCFNSAGTHLASGGGVEQVDIWMLSTRRRLRGLTADSPVLALAFQNDLSLDGILQSGAVIAWQQYRDAKPVFDARTTLIDATWIACPNGYDAAILTRWADGKPDAVLLHGKLWSSPYTHHILEATDPWPQVTASKWAQDPKVFAETPTSGKPGETQPGYLAALSDGALEVYTFQYQSEYAIAKLASTSSEGYKHKLAVRRLAVLDHDSPVSSTRFSFDMSDVFTGCQDGTVRVWSWQAELEREVLRGQEAPVAKLQLVRNPYLAVAGTDGGLNIWKLGKDPSVTHTCHHDASITALAYHEGTAVLASADEKGIIRLWKLP